MLNGAVLLISICYFPGQWSPFYPQGKRVYDRCFLIALRASPESQKRANLPDIPEIIMNVCLVAVLLVLVHASVWSFVANASMWCCVGSACVEGCVVTVWGYVLSLWCCVGGACVGGCVVTVGSACVIDVESLCWQCLCGGMCSQCVVLCSYCVGMWSHCMVLCW